MNLSHRVTKEEEGKQVGELIRAHFSLSTGLLRRLKRREDGITLDGLRVTVLQTVKEGQLLQCRAEDEESSAVLPCPIPLSVLYEDEWLTVIDKPAGLPTHPSSFAPHEPSVAGAYLARKQKGLFHPVNRLDKGTSGIMVIAQNGYAHEKLSAALQKGSFRREYEAVCEGHFNPKEGCLRAPIGRCEGSVIKREVRSDGREAVTHFRVIRESTSRSLVRLSPQTGRTHQLRVHMAHLGHPLVGDFLYGTEDPSLISRPPLHSCFLSLLHPGTGKRLELSCSLPEDMSRLLEE